mmetsp:Transcript_28753/g.40650  ORF Transcript_28753/g.40650 Transcript_28753/m.40650 type:complete len:140 (+) Transcript_28753:51-470(+)
MLAGGTGIAPMFQALWPILTTPGDTTQVRLLYSNKTPEDIMLKTQLDLLVRKYPDRLSVFYIIGDHEHDSRHDGIYDEAGWIDQEKIQRLGFPVAEDSIVWVCGVDAMYVSLAGSRMKKIEEGSALHNLGFTDDTVWRS